jgi:organic radical activating enzyme
MREISQTTLKVNEIFYSLQGEGSRAGEASIFIRLAGCNLKCDFCDTEYEKFTEMTIPEVVNEIEKFEGGWIVWSGGEPLLQLTCEMFRFFQTLGYAQAIETNGTQEMRCKFDYITVSPKSKLKKDFYIHSVIDEIRIPFTIGKIIPNVEDLPTAKNYYLSPIFNEDKMDQENLQACIKYCLDHPEWKLSIQQQKIWKIK